MGRYEIRQVQLPFPGYSQIGVCVDRLVPQRQGSRRVSIRCSCQDSKEKAGGVEIRQVQLPFGWRSRGRQVGVHPVQLPRFLRPGWASAFRARQVGVEIRQVQLCRELKGRFKKAPRPNSGRLSSLSNRESQVELREHIDSLAAGKSGHSLRVSPCPPPPQKPPTTISPSFSPRALPDQ